MASGDVVVYITAVMPPTTVFAFPGVRTGGSTPAEQMPVWQFDAAADSYLDYYFYLSGYTNLGLTFTVEWIGASATTGVARMGMAIRRRPDDTVDFDASHTYDFNEADWTTASVSGESAYDTITFTNGSDMNSIVNNEAGVLRVFRNADHANDTMSGYMQLVTLIGRET